MRAAEPHPTRPAAPRAKPIVKMTAIACGTDLSRRARGPAFEHGPARGTLAPTRRRNR